MVKPVKPCGVRVYSRNNHSNTVSKAPVAHPSSPRDKSLVEQRRPRGIAAAVGWENMPPACFRIRPTVQQALIETSKCQKTPEPCGFPGFFFCLVLTQPDPTKTFLSGTTRGQLSFFRLYGTTSGTTTGTTFRHLGVTISVLILPISFI